MTTPNGQKTKIEKIIKTVCENIDWIEFHKDMATRDFGMNLIVWEDGETSLLTSNSWPGDTDLNYVIFKTWGAGNTDYSIYAEGWCEQELDEYDDFTGNYIETEIGRVLSSDEMIMECIEEGDFEEQIEMWKEEIERKFTENYVISVFFDN